MQTQETKTQPTITEFKTWCRVNKPLALDVVKARAIAEVERKRVDAYILPIFLSYGFCEPGDCGNGEDCRRHRHGKPIENLEQLYLCEDEVSVAKYYAQCDFAHREHGFTGPDGHCPALIADSLRRDAEYALLKSGCEIFSLDDVPVLEMREKMLNLLLGACLTKNR